MGIKFRKSSKDETSLCPTQRIIILYRSDKATFFRNHSNIAITLIHQTDVFLRKLLERLQEDFLRNGGIKEQMYNARINYRNGHK